MRRQFLHGNERSREGGTMIGWMIGATLLIGIFLGQSASAAGDRFTQREIMMTPPFCQDYFLNRRERAGYWHRLGVVHYHHYCIGIAYLNRSFLKPRKNLHIAINNLDSGEAWPDNHPLKPQMYMNLGRAYELADKDFEAVKYYLKATQLKRDYAPAYAALSALYQRLGDKEEARSVLEAGLQHAPDSKMLQSRLEKLGP